MKTDIKAIFRFDEHTANIFDDMLERSVPFYSEVQRMILEITKTFAQRKSNIYDFGCSTGNTLLNLAKTIDKKNVNLIGIDYSEAMLKKSRLKLKRGNLINRCVLINVDLDKGINIENASVVIMNLTLQFLKPKNRGLLISQIYDGLRKNGCLILVEKIRFYDSALNKTFIKLYYDFKMRNGYSKFEIEKKRRLLKGFLVPFKYNDNVKLLKDNGFIIIDEFFRWYNFCGIIAIKD